MQEGQRVGIFYLVTIYEPTCKKPTLNAIRSNNEDQTILNTISALRKLKDDVNKSQDKAFLSTCSASSLVGVIIRARKKPFGAILSASSPFCSNILAVFSRSSRRRCKMGNPKASVFPEPVSAAPIIS